MERSNIEDLSIMVSVERFHLAAILNFWHVWLHCIIPSHSALGMSTWLCTQTTVDSCLWVVFHVIIAVWLNAFLRGWEDAWLNRSGWEWDIWSLPQTGLSELFTLCFPDRTVLSNTISNYMWEASSYAAFNARRRFTQISTTVYSQILIHAAERCGAMSSGKTCPRFHTAINCSTGFEPGFS